MLVQLIVLLLLFSSLCTAQESLKNVTQTESGKKERAQYGIVLTKCMKKIGVTPDLLESNLRKDIIADDFDEKFKCVMACVYQHQLKLKEDGSLDIEYASMNIGKRLKASERDEIIKAIQACSNIKGDSDCDTIFKIIACLKDNRERHR